MPTPATQPRLLVRDSNGESKAFDLPPRGLTRIGYSMACDLRVEGSGVEPIHCEISRGGTGLVLRDLAADTRTRVNGQPVSTRTLMDGDSICVGGVEMVFSHTASRRDELSRIEYKRQRLEGTSKSESGRKGSGKTRRVVRRAVTPETTTDKVGAKTTTPSNPTSDLAELAAASARRAALTSGRETRLWIAGESSTLEGPSRRVVVARSCDQHDALSRSLSGGMRQTMAVTRLRLALDTIYRVSNLVLAEQDLDGLFATVVDVVMEALGPDRAFLVSANGEGLAIRVSRPELDKDSLGALALGPSLSLVRACIDENLAVITEDAQLDPRFSSHDSVQSLGIRSAMCAPLRSASTRHGAIYVDRVSSGQAFSEPELDLLAAIGRQAGLAIERTRAHEATEQMFLSCVRALVNAIEAKDVYTSGHSERVASHAMSIAERLGMDGKAADAVRLGALLHDIGKIGVPEAILTKQGRLSNEEYEVIKTHPARGAEILGAIRGIDQVVAAVRWHHEAMNGLGYPDKLSGGSIPLPARIVAVADAFDAMTSNRSYRRNMSVEETVAEFRRCAGTQFDGDVCEAMIALLEEGHILPSHDMNVLGIDVRTRIYTRKVS